MTWQEMVAASYGGGVPATGGPPAQFFTSTSEGRATWTLDPSTGIYSGTLDNKPNIGQMPGFIWDASRGGVTRNDPSNGIWAQAQDRMGWGGSEIQSGVSKSGKYDFATVDPNTGYLTGALANFNPGAIMPKGKTGLKSWNVGNVLKPVIAGAGLLAGVNNLFPNAIGGTLGGFGVAATPKQTGGSSDPIYDPQSGEYYDPQTGEAVPFNQLPGASGGAATPAAKGTVLQQIGNAFNGITGGKSLLGMAIPAAITAYGQSKQNSAANDYGNNVIAAAEKARTENAAAARTAAAGIGTAYSGASKSISDAYTAAANRTADSYGTNTANLKAGMTTAAQGIRDTSSRLSTPAVGLNNKVIPMLASAYDTYKAAADNPYDPALAKQHALTASQIGRSGDQAAKEARMTALRAGDVGGAQAGATRARFATDSALATENAGYGVAQRNAHLQNQDRLQNALTQGAAIGQQGVNTAMAGETVAANIDANLAQTLSSLGVNHDQFMAGLTTEGQRLASGMDTQAATDIANIITGNAAQGAGAIIDAVNKAAAIRYGNASDEASGLGDLAGSIISALYKSKAA